MINHNVAFTGGSTFHTVLKEGREIANHGHEVTVLASSARGVGGFRYTSINGVKLVEAPGIFPKRWRYGYDPYDTLRRVVWVNQRSFDIVHAFDCRPVVIYPALAAKRRGSKFVSDWRDWFGKGGSVEERSNPMLRNLLRPVETYYEETFRLKADALLVLNSVLERRAIQLGVQPERITVLRIGSDLEHIKLLDRDTSRKEMGLPLGSPILGYLGALFTQDAHLLLSAFELIRSEHPQANLVLIGNPKSEIPILPGIIRTGFVSYEDVNKYLAACDVLCLPLTDTLANRGRLPSKMWEYFPAGRPTVASDVGDVGVVIREAQAGLVSKPEINNFADQILRLLEDATLRDQLGRNARLVAEGRYNWSVVVQQLETIYRKLLTS